jgi:sugar/nucleoside kinase (ribokinase family)
MNILQGSNGPRILVVGYNAFDVIVPASGFPAPDEKAEVSRVITCGGGPGATASVALARLGAQVKLITPLTDDVPGRLQREELLAAGVDLAFSPIVVGHASPKAVILVDEARAQRTIFWSRGDVPHLEASHGAPGLLDDIDLLYTDGHEAAVSIRLARLARERGLPVVLDAGSVRAGSVELVSLCTDVVSSRGFAPDLTGHAAPLDALRAMRDMGPERVGMTFGSEGVLGLENDRPLPVAAFTVPVKDTTGAGDAFHAGYAFGLARGLDFGSCLDWGSAVAGLKCRDWGGRLGLPDLKEVQDLLDNGRRNSLDGLEARMADSGK